MRTEFLKPKRRHIVSAALFSAVLTAGVTSGAVPPETAEAQPVTVAPAAAAAAAAQAQASWPVVKSGQRGVDVATVQLLLTAQGHATAADGIFGSGTAGQVKAFQRAKGLTADGVVGPKTWAKLIVTVKSGSKGPAVKALQQQLTDNGYPATADGAYGPATAIAVKAFQKAKGLTVDGIVGPNTWARLVNGGGGSGGGNPGGGTVWLKFDKNQSDPKASSLSVIRGGQVVITYRAGSGNGVNNKNECVRNQGWLPNGDYTVGMHTKSKDGVIKGYAIQLSDKKCTNGTLRSALFIHSEMTRNGGQGTLEPQRWDEPRDFGSNGCIKLRPADIMSLFKKLDEIGWPKSLQVVS
ncbi:peptidoglycan-binding protein [Streptomyces sp. NPDC002680]|uniref:L,D-transpeptidase family protein n=1 Tax=Streptomyces sp. NPDC002680 TaxID=3364659 RepID=UPI0036982DF6